MSRPYRIKLATVAFVAIPALTAVDVARNASLASTDTRTFLLEKSEQTRDHEELAEFKRLLVALDDALRKDAVERYASLNQRLHLVMERELKQSREKATEFAALEKKRAAPPPVMTADALAPLDPFRPQDERLGKPLKNTAALRADEMHRLLTNADALEFGLETGAKNTGAYTRNAAILDRFLKLLREDLAEVEAEIRNGKTGN